MWKAHIADACTDTPALAAAASVAASLCIDRRAALGTEHIAISRATKYVSSAQCSRQPHTRLHDKCNAVQTKVPASPAPRFCSVQPQRLPLHACVDSPRHNRLEAPAGLHFFQAFKAATVIYSFHFFCCDFWPFPLRDWRARRSTKRTTSDETGLQACRHAAHPRLRKFGALQASTERRSRMHLCCTHCEVCCCLCSVPQIRRQAPLSRLSAMCPCAAAGSVPETALLQSMGRPLAASVARYNTKNH